MTIEQRLDALDRALLGVLPRSERLAIVSQVESRARELGSTGSAAESAEELVSSREALPASKRRSRLALSSGILGIVALVLLFAMPITYLLVMTVGEELGEFVSMGLLSIHVLVVAVGGLVAIIMGIAGLVSLSRRKGRLSGHGWAITGLCTAPLPTFVGGLLVLVTSLSLFAVQSVTVEGAPGVATASASFPISPVPPATYCEPCTSSPYGPAPAMPANSPLPLRLGTAAGSYCAPQDEWSTAKPPAISTKPAAVACPAPVELRPSSSYQLAPTAGAPAPAAAALTPAAPAPAAPATAAPAPAAPATAPTEGSAAPAAPATPARNAEPSKAPIRGPLVPGEVLDPPSDDQVMRAWEKANPVQGGLPFLHEIQRNNVRIVKEKIADYVDPPRVVPLIGPVQLHHNHYKCTVYYTEITRVGWPVAYTQTNEDGQEVVYVDNNHFHMMGNVDANAKDKS
jgi:hypothetical protein